METITNQSETKKDFVAPTKPEDFNGESVIKHTYENGKSVAFVLLKNGKIAKIREGKGSDVENAMAEINGDKKKYMSAMMAAVVTIDGKAPNMFEIAEESMKDYTSIQAAFTEINF